MYGRMWRLLQRGLMSGTFVALTATMLAAASPVPAQANYGFSYRPGYSLQNGWLCFARSGWMHCTRRWAWQGGHPVSLNPAWVPNAGHVRVRSVATTHTTKRASVTHAHPVPVTRPAPVSTPVSVPVSTGGVTLAGDFCPGEARTIPGNVQKWMIPAGCMSGVFWPNAANYYHPRVSWGQCSWWPSAMKHVPWPEVLPRHSYPRPGAIVYWPPYDNGGFYGHYGLVEAVGNGWILTSEMNMWWRGGGFGRVVFVYRPLMRGMVFYW